MGEIADMMINGFMCEMCGVYLDGEEPGHPRYCSQSCANDRGINFDEDEDDEEMTVKIVIDALEINIDILFSIADDLDSLKKSKKAKALRGLIKNIEIFKTSLGGNK